MPIQIHILCHFLNVSSPDVYIDDLGKEMVTTPTSSLDNQKLTLISQGMQQTLTDLLVCSEFDPWEMMS